MILLIDFLLGSFTLSCWLGVLGMWRMREPIQALHYLALPVWGAAVFLSAAVFLQTGSGQAAWKTVLTCVVLIGINSVVAHATARAFRARKFRHWQPQAGDPIGFAEIGKKQ